LVGSMMETDGPLRRFFFGLTGTYHDGQSKSFLSDRPSWEALTSYFTWLSNPSPVQVEIQERKQARHYSRPTSAAGRSPPQRSVETCCARHRGLGTFPGQLLRPASFTA
jgi:hypothetical protein